MTAVPPRPAAPDATAGDGLRELQSQLYALLGDRTSNPYGQEWEHGPLQLIVRAVLALPALRDVLAAAAPDAEAIKRVRELESALGLIDRNGCENLTRGRCSDDPGRSRDSDYTSTRWCPPCIAADALEATP